MAKPKVLAQTPASLGYTFPPEWHPHTGTWFSWPRPEGISFPGKYHTVPENLARIMCEIQSREQVHVNVPNENYEHLGREHGPAFVLRRRKMRTKKAMTTEAAIVDWGFNAWGGKYPPWADDDAVPTKVATELGLPVFYPGIVMEGGAVDFNGAGTVLTTTDCLLNKNRNPRLSKQQIEQYLKDYYGQEHVCWLTGGIEGDDTDGHVDDLARFISPRQ